MKNSYYENQGDFFLKASKHGKIGLQFIFIQQIHHYEELLRSIDSYKHDEINLINNKIDNLKISLKIIEDDITKDDSNSYYNRIQLFTSMLEYIPTHAQDRILQMFDHHRLHDKVVKFENDSIWNVYGQNADYMLLWEHYKVSEIDRQEELEYLAMQKFTWWDALYCILTLDHLKQAWENNSNISSLASEICTVNGNLAIVAGLIMSLSFPFYVFNTVGDGWDTGDVGSCIYLYG